MLPQPDSLPWWKNRPTKGRNSPVPYKQVALTLLNDADTYDVNTGHPKTPATDIPPTDIATLSEVAFFPFGEHDVAELRAMLLEESQEAEASGSGTQQENGDANGYTDDNLGLDAVQAENLGRFERMVDEWKDVFAFAGGQRLYIARPHGDGIDFFWEWHMDNTDQLYNLSWSYDPFSHSPLIALSGRAGLVYIIDLVAKRVRRTLKGHGAGILGMAFSPIHPHILATSSEDRSIRIWNIFGGDLNRTRPPREDDNSMDVDDSMTDSASASASASASISVGTSGRESSLANGRPSDSRATSITTNTNTRGEDDMLGGSAQRSHDPGLLRDDELDWNYPMGEADEGECLVAILAGEGVGGHKWNAVGVAFHPRYNAIATCGADYAVKIWMLPEIPALPDDPALLYTSRSGYRLTIVYHPVFSTARLHDDVVDCIEWLSDDVLVTKCKDHMVLWKWLGAGRFLHEGYTYADVLPAKRDYNDSHSFRILARHKFGGPVWYQRFGVHHAFSPPPGLEGDILRKRKCTDVLVSTGWVGKNPEIFVFNPCMISFPQEGSKEALKAPEFELRRDIVALPEESDVEEDEEVVMDSDPDTSVTSEEAPEKDLGTEKKKGKGKAKGKAAAPLPVDYDSHYPTMTPWTIKPKGFLTAANEVAKGNAGASEPSEAGTNIPQTPNKSNGSNTPQTPKKANGISAAARAAEQQNKLLPSAKVNTVIRCTSFSPGGAEWLVGVGEWGSLILYRLITQAEVDKAKRTGPGVVLEPISDMESVKA